MQSPLPTPSSAEFAPLPLRQRGVLETLDTAFKLFRQYWKPLLAWAAIAGAVNLIPYLSFVTFFFTPPLVIGAVCCCMAAAVRGQNVGFKQCWRFLKPRYWNVVAMHVLSIIIFGVAIIGLIILAAIGIAGVSYLLASIGDSWVTILLGVILFGILLIVCGVITTALGMWQALTAIVACMEDDPQNSGAMKRAWGLMKGHWRMVIHISMILGLSMLVLWGMLVGISGLFVGMDSLRNIARGYDTLNDSSGILGLVASITVSSYVLMLFYLPLYYLSATLLYLDFRVRKEALDLEWTAHATSPQPETAPPPSIAHSSNIFNPTAQELQSPPETSVWDEVRPVSAPLAHTPAPIAPADTLPPYSPPPTQNAPRVELAPEAPTTNIYNTGLSFSTDAPASETPNQSSEAPKPNDASRDVS